MSTFLLDLLSLNVNNPENSYNSQDFSKKQEKCPSCGKDILRSGRCKYCNECGWSSCDL